MAKQKRQQPRTVLRLKVKGAHIKAGRIPIPELVKICEGAQNAINRQAETLKGGKSLRPGPVSGQVAEQCTLELFAINKGSAVLLFAPPDPVPSPQASLELDVPTLGERAVADVVNAITAVRRNRMADIPEGVLRSFQEMGALLNNGVTSIDWTVPKAGDRKQTKATFDLEIVERIRQVSDRPFRRAVTLDGRLEMADFKLDDLRCMIQTSDGSRPECSFPESLSDDVYRALRHKARVSGIGTFNGRTKRLEHVELESLSILDPKMFDAERFFALKDLASLAREQGIGYGDDIPASTERLSDAEIDAFLADIDQMRS